MLVLLSKARHVSTVPAAPVENQVCLWYQLLLCKDRLSSGAQGQPEQHSETYSKLKANHFMNKIHGARLA